MFSQVIPNLLNFSKDSQIYSNFRTAIFGLYIVPKYMWLGHHATVHNGYSDNGGDMRFLAKLSLYPISLYPISLYPMYITKFIVTTSNITFTFLLHIYNQISISNSTDNDIYNADYEILGAREGQKSNIRV